VNGRYTGRQHHVGTVDTRLSGEDGDYVGTMKLSTKDLHRILEQGRCFSFLTTKERGEGPDRTGRSSDVTWKDTCCPEN
jgi:hypothetical protein